MSDIKKLVNNLVYKGTKELWFDPKNYETKEASNNYFYSPFFSGYVGDLDIPFKVRLPLSIVEKELKIDVTFGSEAGYITIQPGNDINYDVKIDTQNEEIEYILTYHYTQSLTKKSDVALILKTYSAFDFINLLKYINIKPASETFINDEFRKAFSRVESDDDKLSWLYENAYPSAIKDRKDEQLWNDLLRLSKYDGEKWFVDTGSAVMNIAQSFSDIKWIIATLKANQETLMDVYNTISGYDTKYAFSTLVNAFIILEGNNLRKPVFLKGSLYTFDKFASTRENKIFRILNQKLVSTRVIASNMGAVTSQDFTTVEDADLNPCDLVIIEDTDIKTSLKKPVKTAPSAAIMLYYMADNADHEAWVKMLRLTLDVAAILTAVYSGGTSSVLIRFAEAGLALTDIAMMDDGIRKFLSDNGGEWFVENWDTIYLMAGLGFLSRVIINGILTRGPALLESLKNIRNIPRNWSLFRKDLEKLIKELEAYEARQAAVISNEIEGVVIDSPLKKLVRLFFTDPHTNLEKIAEDLVKKGVSVRQVEEGTYEVTYKGVILKSGREIEAGQFVKSLYYKTARQLENFLKRELEKMFVKNKQAFMDMRLKTHWKGIGKITQMWEQEIVKQELLLDELRRVYYKYSEKFPGLLKGGFNQAEFKITIENYGKLVDEVEEFSISGAKDVIEKYFGNPSKLPPNTIDIISDYKNYQKFIQDALDFNKRFRGYDSEIKFIYNFLKNHLPRGNKFTIETKNIFVTCDSCKRELLMLKEYLKSIGKEVEIIVHSDETIAGTRALKDKLKNK